MIIGESCKSFDMIIIMDAVDGVAVGGFKPPFMIHSTNVV